MDKQSLDAVTLMRTIRDRLSKTFRKDDAAETKSLEQVRHKYNLSAKQKRMHVASPPPDYPSNTTQSDL